MNTVFGQALQLTAMGMGMTFASIGALVLGMLLMTRITRGKGRAAGDKISAAVAIGPEEPGASVVDAVNGNLETRGGDLSAGEATRAAVAAVAVALSQRQAIRPDSDAARAAAAAVAVALGAPQPVTSGPEIRRADVWNAHVRGQYLSRRADYDARRTRV